MARRAPPDREVLQRAVRWARLPGYGHRVAEARRKFGLSAGEWRKAVREFGSMDVLSTDEDLMLAGMHGGKPTTVESLIFYYDWINHAGISPAEVIVVLERLIEQGRAKRTGEKFQLTRDWP